jgi:myo-inositol-1-phosphate synthase
VNWRAEDRYKVPTREEYTARFTMMIRCSYACLVGVAFVNASPVITSNVAKKTRAASIFLEWVGGLIEIHSRNDYKLTVVAMGALWG